MASHNSYSIPILNDLHELYPDILYRPSQFQTSNDIIQYILDRGVQRRFRQESERYQSRYQQTYVNNNPPPPLPPRRSPLVESYNVLPDYMLREHLYPSHVIPRQYSIEQALSYLIGQNILDDRPSSDRPSSDRPTEEHLRTHTTVSPIVDENNTSCSICQDELTNNQMARILHHCGHIFHKSCIDTWFESHVTCPTCRHDIRIV